MDSRQIQNGAALAIGALLAFAISTEIQHSLDFQRFKANVEISRDVEPQLARQLGKLDAAGRDALVALASDAPLKDIRSELTAAGSPQSISAALAVSALGAAEFVLRDGDLKLRRTDLADATPAGAAAFRDAAQTVARTQAAAAETLWIGAVAAGASEAGRFWALWRDAGSDHALLALLTVLPARAQSDAIGGDPYGVVALHIGAPDRTAPAASAEFAVAAGAIGERWVQLKLRGARPDVAAIALREIAPQLAISMLMAIAVVLLLRAHRANVAAFDEQQQRIIRDIRGKQTALDASEARFRHLAESTNVIPWTADLEHQRFTYVGPQIEDVSGYPASTWQATGFWMQHIHPGDRQRVISEINQCAEAGRFATVDYRIRAADGRILHVRNMLSVVKKKKRDGAEVRMTPVAQGFMLDVTETKTAAITLELARQKAEEANRVKSEFLANMSHELRTPLNAVIGFSEIMKDQLFGELDARYREYAANVHASGTHLLQLINDVLDLSKIEAGRVELAEEPTDLGQLLLDCRTLLQERMQAAGVQDRVEIEDGLPSLLLDERRIRQVILNLMSNAIKFTPPGGTVTLICKHQPGRGVLLAVRDTGIGMDAEEIPKALSKFGQLDGDLTRKHDGTGLGLPIAKSLVEMHGGEFEVESTKGYGTEMRVWLPETRVTRAA